MADRPAESPLQALGRRRMALQARRRYAALGMGLCVLGLALWLAFSQVVLLYRNQGMGMFPAMQDGDLILAYRLQKTYGNGDAVVYIAEGQRYLGRVAAGETDIVRMDDSGSLAVNGKPRNGEILYPTFAEENSVYPLRVPEGSVYILGDYRIQTRDSRDFGPIPLEHIQGKVIAVVRRRGL